MGRADVLLRFLQLIDKDCPRDLDPFLEGLDANTEQRPLADQVVDRIIAGNSELYEVYAQARREVGLRNPYASPEDESEPREYEEAVGRFVTRWTAFEAGLRRWLDEAYPPAGPGLAPSGTPLYMLRHAPIPEPLRGELEYVRKLRNQVVHGVDRPAVDTLLAASVFLERVQPELEGATSTARSERQSRPATRVRKSSRKRQ